MFRLIRRFDCRRIGGADRHSPTAVTGALRLATGSSVSVRGSSDCFCSFGGGSSIGWRRDERQERRLALASSSVSSTSGEVDSERRRVFPLVLMTQLSSRLKADSVVASLAVVADDVSSLDSATACFTARRFQRTPPLASPAAMRPLVLRRARRETRSEQQARTSPRPRRAAQRIAWFRSQDSAFVAADGVAATATSVSSGAASARSFIRGQPAGRREDVDHAAALGARLDLPQETLVADPQPGLAGFAAEEEGFHGDDFSAAGGRLLQRGQVACSGASPVAP